MRAGMPPLNQVLVAYRPTGEDGCQPLCRDGVVTTLPPLVSSDLGGPVMAPAVCTLPDQRLVMPSELAPMSHSGLPAPVLTIPLARGVTSQPMHVCRPAMPSVMVSAPTQQLLAPLPNYVNYVNHQALPLLPVYIASQPQQSFTIQPVQSSHHAASTVVEATQTQQFVAQPPILVSHRSPPMVPSPTQQIFTQELPAASDATPPLTSISLQMELVWHGEFDSFFRQFYPHTWSLYPTTEAPYACAQSGWYSYRDSAKVRFHCKHCGHGWTSMNGRVLFWFELTPPEGRVHFQLFGQQCGKCKNEGFEHAMWYPQEVKKVIYNIFTTIGEVYYDFRMPRLCLERRLGKPRTKHNNELCEACISGLCNSANESVEEISQDT